MNSIDLQTKQLGDRNKVALMLSNVVAYRKWKIDLKYVHFCCVSMIIIYCFTLLTCALPSMYACLFSIVILVMEFQDKKLIVRGAFISIIVLVISNIQRVWRQLQKDKVFWLHPY